ncbi:MAG: recombination protein RecR [Desulfobacterales bacterium]|nr:recombination protein RecR [Desulfobacterales bacterium]MCP4158966.1 recombination protein RecR [Deltaproteobacteria bacterium]
MNHYPKSVLDLIENLSKLPGVGKKTAERLSMHILRAPRSEAEKLASSIITLKNNMRLCGKCFALSEGELCSICSNPGRESSIICVVERIADMVAIEKSGGFKGLYHVLQGVLSPMDGIGPNDLRIRELFTRIKSEHIREVVVATSTNVEGEATASYLTKKLKETNITVTRIASGVPMGGDLKYVDQVTLKMAMEARFEK